MVKFQNKLQSEMARWQKFFDGVFIKLLQLLDGKLSLWNNVSSTSSVHVKPLMKISTKLHVIEGNFLLSVIQIISVPVDKNHTFCNDEQI